MAVYSFYYVKSRIVNDTLWKGKKWFERVVMTMIPFMGVCGLCFFWLPIKDFEYYGFLKDGECHLARRRWILIFWVVGDVILCSTFIAFYKTDYSYKRGPEGYTRISGHIAKNE